MLFQYILAIPLAVSPLLYSISAAPVGPFAGNPAYSVDITKTRGDREWYFQVYSKGYKKFDEDGDQETVDSLEVDIVDKRLTVYKAMNGLDEADPRLKMRQVLKECWTMTGLKPEEIKEVKGDQIDNKNMQDALTDCRKGMNLGGRADFTVSAADTETAKKNCWDRLGKTIFSSVIKGAISDFSISKELVQLRVDNTWRGDNLYYTFS
ncbi:uncharacterized protein CTRU02_215382 [Colletotrichum truncatum]|uniref:Uncharacterized protein n=1 Tax=Colletotrichum truncatum TaxID=5467 RepID=A0ACC3YD06_COLTU|nr:uncharacterized protein CTRU02_13338 [Colletotrichum truncatum]KAF6783575.1 hypothetical protein CTRU02_13338 [Colletotrichum truncatum]